jgi:hypothetical protein
MTREITIALGGFLALACAAFLAALASGVGFFHAAAIGIFALAFMAWAGAFVYLLFNGAKEIADVPDSARVDASLRDDARVSGMPAVPENLVRLADRARALRGTGFSTPAAKGFRRDDVVGRDQVTPEERRHLTQPVSPWGVN